MSKTSSSAELKVAIQFLELEQQAVISQLKEQVYTIAGELKPVNLITSAMKDVASSPYLIDRVVVTAMGIGTGYLSRKLITGTSGSPVRKLIGSALQFAITTMAAKRIVPVSLIGRLIFKKLFKKKEIKLQEE
jgi:hypothetical protein